MENCVDACRHLIGLKLPFQDGVFEITESNINALCHYDAREYSGEQWYQVSWIYWGGGQGTSLYYNGDNRLIVVHDGLCRSSTVLKEYDVRVVLKETYVNADVAGEEYDAVRGKKRRLAFI